MKLEAKQSDILDDDIRKQRNLKAHYQRQHHQAAWLATRYTGPPDVAIRHICALTTLLNDKRVDSENVDDESNFSKMAKLEIERLSVEVKIYKIVPSASYRVCAECVHFLRAIRHVPHVRLLTFLLAVSISLMIYSWQAMKYNERLRAEQERRMREYWRTVVVGFR
jgi:hypothetical protein